MNLNELNKPKSSKALNENVARNFGQKLNIDSFTTEQLRAARDTLVTKIAEFETNSSFNAVLEDTGYMKNRALLDVITQAISERLTLDESAKKDKFSKGMQKVKGDFEKKFGDKSDKVMDETATKMAKSESIEEAMTILRGTLSENVLTEGAEEEAALIMSSRDMVDRITGWLDDVANMKAERYLELIDSIRDEKGSAIADQFSQLVKPALEQIYDVLESQRQQLANAVTLLTGDEAPMMGDEAPVDPATPAPDAMGAEGDLAATADEFGASAPATGGSEPTGRVKRESVENFKKKV